MHISAGVVANLIHAEPYGTLATRSVQMPGYPFATVLPFVPDSRHRPVSLISRLAEHTKNLLADRRASLLVFRPEEGDVQTGSRLAILSGAVPIEASAELVTRYLAP